MRKYLKWFFISLASLLVIVLISVCILLWLVFTPERLTPIVRSQSGKYIPYPTEFGEVELTLFSTFPQFGIKVTNLKVISPGTGAPCDTLLKAGELVGMIDARKYWKTGEIVINEFLLSNGSVNIYSDSLGRTNYQLFLAEKPVEQEISPEMEFGMIDLEKMVLKSLNLSYTDLAAGLNTAVTNISASISGNIKDDNLNCHLLVDNAIVSLEFEGERYLKNARMRLQIPAEILMSRQLVVLNDASASVNDLGITINGSIENDTLNNKLITDFSYITNSWLIEDILELVPPIYLSDLGDIDASGTISSKGNITGFYNDSIFPLIDMSLSFAGGSLKHAEIPFPLNNLNADLVFFSDFKDDLLSYLQINYFEFKTQNSSFTTNGKISNIFSDMRISLTTNVSVLTDEIKSFIPEEIILNPDSRIDAIVSADFTMGHATSMALEKIKLAGTAFLSDFSITHDSLSISSSYAKIDVALPNPFVSDRNTNFAFVKVAADELTASNPGSIDVFLKNTHLFLEMSDIRDTTALPDLFCGFSTESLIMGMDTINLAIERPMGNIYVSHVTGAPWQTEIDLAYTSYDMTARVGQNSSMVSDLTLNMNIINDNSQEDFFLKWLVNGFVDMNNGKISLSSLSHPVLIPAIKMDFDHETFKIQEGRIIIDKSDFGLTGTLNNVLSYSRGDSILRGNFNFTSDNTDLSQLMALTNGIGSEETDVYTTEQEKSSTGPYMVPLGVDFLLKADIKQATRDADTIINIVGDVRVNDGTLVLDALKFTTPAADMQLTAMYRTPRKNHLYLGVDYHMMDVEISRLLQMLPEIDTLMPMLRSFGGSGEFHIAVETYLDSLYNIKKSTLRGASSIKGEDLVLMDGETFSEIAKTLRFSRKAENRVDSLSAEFTIFREEIDVYPFLLVMDRYKVVVGGRHNFDLSFDYHISLIESPLPLRLGLDVGGTIDDLKYRLASPRYSDLYRPVSRRVIESRQMEFRQIIREALLQNVRE